ncbi:MAG TPA: hypothetical protein VNY52_00505 [Solirubrobacteraceae bacterium]|nr:hypothetical protein [Solirubrobacteraceae bacterium]
MLITTTTTTVTASALPTEGPWYHVGGKKLAEGEKNAKEGTGKGVGFKQYGIISKKELEIECEKTTGTGRIWNGSHQGEGSGSIKSTGCSLRENPGCGVEPITINGRASLWYHVTSSGEKTGKIQILFEPPSGETIYELTITMCSLKGKYPVLGDVAAEPSPEKEEVLKGKVIFPKEQQKRLWQPSQGEREPKLKFGSNEARIEGEEEIELVSGEKAGVFET